MFFFSSVFRYFCSSSFSCFSTEHFLLGQRSDSGKVVWWRHSHDSAAAASAQRILIHCLAFWCIFDMQKGIPALKKFDKLLQPFQHHGQRRWHSPNRRVGAVCVCSLWRWGERNDLWCSRQREQNQRDLETEVVFQQWDSRSERWTPNPVSVFKTTPGVVHPSYLSLPSETLVELIILMFSFLIRSCLLSCL